MLPHAPGDLVHGYEIVGTLGRGGLGTTFEAIHKETGARVALKRLAIANAEEWKRVELFEREAQVLSRLDHPGIPRYRDHFTVEGEGGAVLYIAQELVEGQSLGALADAGRVPMGESMVRRIAEELLGVLDYLGRQSPPVIHRDIKPDNVIRRAGGSVVLVDFGAARSDLGKAGGGSTTVGTYGYMSPEQLHGVATPATDIYGLACTLLFLLTGRSPTDLPRRKLRIEFREVVQLTPAFASWLDRALEPAPEDRFASAASALAALRGREVATRFTPEVARKLVPVVVAGAALSVGVGGWMVLRRPAEPPVVPFSAEREPRRPVPPSVPLAPPQRAPFPAPAVLPPAKPHEPSVPPLSCSVKLDTALAPYVKLEQGLVAYWKLDGNLVDSIGNLDDLIAHGDEGAKFADGRIGQGLLPGICGADYFCKNSSWLEAQDASSPNLRFDSPSDDFTVSMWAVRDPSRFADATWWSYALLANDQIYLGAMANGAYPAPAHPTLTLVLDGRTLVKIVDQTFDFRSPEHTGVWTHVVAFRRGDVAGLRIDGHETTSIIARPRPGHRQRPFTPQTTPGKLFIGAERNGYPWQGEIDEVGKWNRALSTTEMSALFDGGPCRP